MPARRPRWCCTRTARTSPRNEWSERQARRTDVRGLRANETTIAELLETVRGPPGDAADCEHRREQFGRNAESVQEQRGVELDVRLDGTIRLPLAQQSQRSLFHVLGKRVQLTIAVA